jgi:zinc and cadmium transporter
VTAILFTLAFGLGAAIISFIALLGVRFASQFTRANEPLFAAFAAGLVIAMAILHLVPEAVQMSERAPVWVLAGFGLGFAIQRGIESWPGKAAAGHPGMAIALAPVLAIGMHSAVDGLVYAVTFSVDFFTGLSASLGLMVHEFPEAIICFVLLQRAGLSDTRAFLFAFAAAGLTTLVAAAIAAPVAATVPDAVLGNLFALVAGIMLHVGATHLLAHAGEAGWRRASPVLVAGALTGLLITTFQGSGGHVHAPLATPTIAFTEPSP